MGVWVFSFASTTPMHPFTHTALDCEDIDGWVEADGSIFICPALSPGQDVSAPASREGTNIFAPQLCCIYGGGLGTIMVMVSVKDRVRGQIQRWGRGSGLLTL